MKNTCTSLLVTLLLVPSFLRAVVPASSGVFGNPSGNASAGSSLALNDRYVLRGAPEAAVNGVANAGEVEVFDAGTRKLLRVLRMPQPTVDGCLGSSLALFGNVVYAGAPGSDTGAGPDGGSVFAFDARTGKLLWAHHNQTANEKLGGAALAVFGPYLAVGVPQGRATGLAPLKSGYVKLLHQKDGSLFSVLTKPNAAADDQMGFSLASSGATLAAGIPGDDTAWQNAGAVLLARLYSTDPISVVPAKISYHMGRSVALHGDWLLAGGDDYHVQVFSAMTRDHVRTLSLGPNVEDVYLGRALAVAGDYAVVSGSGMFSHEGLAHFFDLRGAENQPETSLAFNHMRPVFAAYDGRLLVADKMPQPQAHDYIGIHKGWNSGLQELATAGPDSDVGALLQDGAVNAQGKAMFGLVLGGGKKGPTQRLAMSTLGNDAGVVVAAGDAFGPQKIRRHESLQMNGFARGLLSVRLAPSGALAVLEDNGSMVSVLMMEGGLVIGGATLSRIHAFNQPSQFNDSPSLAQRATALAGLKRGTGDATAANDSLICTPGGFILPVTQVREGQASPLGGYRIGQLSPRFARVADKLVFSAALVGEPGNKNIKSAVLARAIGSGNNELIVQAGQMPPGAPEGRFSAFLGECVNLSGRVLFRARMSGVPASRNEGLWSDRSGQLSLLLRKGDIDGHSLRPFTRFLRFFLLNDNSVVVWARLGGKGITAANDHGLWLLRQGTSLPELILREGSVADSCGEARIGAIQRVDVDANGKLVVLASLAGTASAKNQVLLTGVAGSADKYEDFLKARLRKGTLIARGGAAQAIRGFSLGNHTADALGAASKGIAKVVGSNGCLFTVDFAGGEKVLMSGKP